MLSHSATNQTYRSYFYLTITVFAMPPALHFQKIRLAQIDFEDTCFSLFPLPIEISDQLKQSLSRVGVLHPPVVKEKYADVFQIVCGNRRLLASRELLDQEACNCLVLPMETSDPDALLLHFEEIIIRRTPSPVEKASFLKKMSGLIGEQKTAEIILPRIGLTPHYHHTNRLLSLLDLEEPLIRSLHAGLLDEKVALELTKMSFSDRMAIFEIISQLSLSVGKQRRLMNGCRELSARSRTSIMDLLAHEEVNTILGHPEANTPQKSTNLMAWLDRKCSPRSAAAEKEFNKFSRSLALPTGTSLSHAQAFESDAMALSITFKNREELQHAWQKIKPTLTE